MGLTSGRELTGLAGAISTIVGADVSSLGPCEKFSTKSYNSSRTVLLSSKAESFWGDLVLKYEWSTEFEKKNKAKLI